MEFSDSLEFLKLADGVISFGILGFFRLGVFSVGCFGILELRQSQEQLCSGIFKTCGFFAFLDLSPCKMCFKTTMQGRSLGGEGYHTYLFI